jgi:hypothetical protein
MGLGCTSGLRGETAFLLFSMGVITIMNIVTTTRSLLGVIIGAAITLGIPSSDISRTNQATSRKKIVVGRKFCSICNGERDTDSNLSIRRLLKAVVSNEEISIKIFVFRFSVHFAQLR